MIEKLYGFIGGGTSSVIAWMVGLINLEDVRIGFINLITGRINLENLLEVFVITIIGGVGGVIGNWIGKRLFRDKEKNESQS